MVATRLGKSGRFDRRAGLQMLCVMALGDCAAGLSFSAHAAEQYQPLFSAEILSTLDDATYERFAKLEQENYQRWRNRNPRARDVAATQRQHRETQAVLRQIEESRGIDAAASERAAKKQARAAKAARNCKAVAAEIAEMKAGGAFYEQDDSGARLYLSDKEIADRVISQQKSYNKHCK